MRKSAFLVILALQSVALSAMAAPLFTKKAESSASEEYGPGGIVQTAVNTSFTFTTLFDPNKKNYTDGLIAQRVENTGTAGKGGFDSSFQAEAWVGSKNKYDTKLWTISDCSDSGWQSGDFYTTSRYGGNGSDNMLRAYNMKTGKYAFSFTSDPVYVDIYVPRDTIKRYAAYLAKNGTDSGCRKYDLPDKAIGALTLSDGDAQVDRVVLEADSDALASTPKVFLVNDKEPNGASSLSIWGPADFGNKSDVVKGFSIKLVYNNGEQAIIPVVNDKFDVQKATLPKSVKIRRVDVEKLK